MVNEILENTGTRMDASVGDARHKLASVRTGRANLSVLDGVRVDYYGTPTPLNQVAALSVPDPTTIAIAPWEPKVLAEVEQLMAATPDDDQITAQLLIWKAQALLSMGCPDRALPAASRSWAGWLM